LYIPTVNTNNSKRIFLSPPHMGGEEEAFIRMAFESNFIAPLGPMVDAFEKEFAQTVGIPHVAALSSGTAGLHLALHILGVGQGDEVFASTLTFIGSVTPITFQGASPVFIDAIGSVTPITFQGASPVFIDADRATWAMDPDLLDRELKACRKRGKLPKAVVPTDLYGQCIDYERILEICEYYNVPVVADAAEALGAKYQKSEIRSQKSGVGSVQRAEGSKQEAVDIGQRAEDRDRKSGRVEGQWLHAGKGARAAVFSFNGNKIITTSGGGMLASDDEELVEKARFLSQQARDPAPHYEHTEIGYNYRMSNILAAIGRGQLRVLNERVNKKREIFDYYETALKDLPGFEFMPEARYGRSNRWLTVLLISPEEFGADREDVRLALEEENIEARPVWKPMHMQPVFQVGGLKVQGLRLKARKGKYRARVVGGEVSEDLFNRGLCLPSGTAMTEEDLERVVSVILKRRRYMGLNVSNYD
jgi:dTDP-4-amino-4,6-dideoxygalactose transaminase